MMDVWRILYGLKNGTHSPTEQKVSFAPRTEFLTFYGNPKSLYDHVMAQFASLSTEI
jgi:hypothetical protein